MWNSNWKHSTLFAPPMGTTNRACAKLVPFMILDALANWVTVSRVDKENWQNLSLWIWNRFDRTVSLLVFKFLNIFDSWLGLKVSTWMQSTTPSSESRSQRGLSINVTMVVVRIIVVVTRWMLVIWIGSSWNGWLVSCCISRSWLFSGGGKVLWRCTGWRFDGNYLLGIAWLIVGVLRLWCSKNQSWTNS